MKIDPIKQSDDSIIQKIRLKHDEHVQCPYCHGKVKIHGYSPRKLIHSTLVNRKCIIFYERRRYKCDSCEITFFESNPFINSSENVTYETKINVLKDLKYVNNTYSSVADYYGVADQVF